VHGIREDRDFKAAGATIAKQHRNIICGAESAGFRDRNRSETRDGGRRPAYRPLGSFTHELDRCRHLPRDLCADFVAESARDLGGIGFFDYLKVGFPLAIVTTVLGTLWLLAFFPA
jgi:hypothetical protein